MKNGGTAIREGVGDGEREGEGNVEGKDETVRK